MRLTFAKEYKESVSTIILFVGKDEKHTKSVTKFDKLTDGHITRAIKAGNFEGSYGETLYILAPQNIKARRIIVVGLGQEKDLDFIRMEEVAAMALRALIKNKETDGSLFIEVPKGSRLDANLLAAHMAYGVAMSAYRFDKYFTIEERKNIKLKTLTFIVKHPEQVKKLYAPLAAVVEGTAFAADLVNEPANVLYPESYVKRLKPLKDLGIEVEILNKSKLEKIGMGALLGVAKGSARDPYVVLMRWNGAKSKKEAPVALVGKGVTFDTGGYSIKTSAGMEEMKTDMTGSAIVVGAMMSLAKRKAKANVVGAIGLVENMISGEAQRPSDIVKTLSGLTVEVLNTDAEGRLVLADVLYYVNQRFKPRAIIDLATLTGAAMAALGQEYGALFTNDPDIEKHVRSVGDMYNELVWPLPMNDLYSKALYSKVADLKNIGNKWGGAITAAKFLEHFVKDVPWAHIDISGIARSARDLRSKANVSPLFGVRLLDRYIAKHVEPAA